MYVSHSSPCSDNREYVAVIESKASLPSPFKDKRAVDRDSVDEVAKAKAKADTSLEKAHGAFVLAGEALRYASALAIFCEFAHDDAIEHKARDAEAFEEFKRLRLKSVVFS